MLKKILPCRKMQIRVLKYYFLPKSLEKNEPLLIDVENGYKN